MHLKVGLPDLNQAPHLSSADKCNAPESNSPHPQLMIMRDEANSTSESPALPETKLGVMSCDLDKDPLTSGIAWPVFSLFLQ